MQVTERWAKHGQMAKLEQLTVFIASAWTPYWAIKGANYITHCCVFWHSAAALSRSIFELGGTLITTRPYHDEVGVDICHHWCKSTPMALHSALKKTPPCSIKAAVTPLVPDHLASPIVTHPRVAGPLGRVAGTAGKVNGVSSVTRAKLSLVSRVTVPAQNFPSLTNPLRIPCNI